MREIVTFQFAGLQLVGTHHRAEPALLPGATDQRFAFLWLNSGYLPRSPVGDVVAHLADRFAADGIASFRFDLPGLGDSQGELADDTQTYFSKVARGLNVSAANALARELGQRFGLKGVIMGGICGASITSIYAGGAADVSGVLGLVLLDPSFKRVEPFQVPAVGAGAAPVAAPSFRRRAKTAVQNLRIQVLQTRVGQGARNLWRRGKPMVAPLRRVLKSLRGESLPADANHPLFDTFCRLVQQRMPMLVLLAGDQTLHAERFDYLEVALRGSSPSVTRHYLPATNHSFVEGNGEADVCRLVTAWLAEGWAEKFQGSRS